MNRRSWVLAALIMAGMPGSRPQAVEPPAQATASAPAAAAASAHADTIRKYCTGCHNGRLKVAGLALDQLDIAQAGDHAEVWEKVVRKLDARMMPPVGQPRPDDATYRALVGWLEGQLDTAATLHADAGRTATFHRLNRAEYANAVRDLLALDIDPRALLPADYAAENGFDNMADTLSVSPLLLERYLSGARTISRLAVGLPPLGPSVETYSAPKLLVQRTRLGDDLPFGSRGGLSVRHQFPVDGKYTFRVRLQRNLYEYVRGMGQPHEIEVRLDGRRLQRFTVGGAGRGTFAPIGFAGVIFGSPEWEEYMHTADAALEVTADVAAGSRVVGVSFVSDVVEDEGIPQPYHANFGGSVDERLDEPPAVESVAVAGPYEPKPPTETASRRQIFVCRPPSANEEEACAAKILGTLARRAYRRPVTSAELATLVRFFNDGRAEGGFENGIAVGLERLLAEPTFLFRVERDPANVAPATSYRLDDVALATRLAFFLWSSVPDDALLDVATRGKLKDPAVLEQQVHRMLADSRSKALTANFAGQWLYLRNVRDQIPDSDLFPDFDDNLREAMSRETELFLDSQIRGDRGVIQLLTADYTFLNERLARHYGIPGVRGTRYRRVTLTPDTHRGGLLGQASILMVTSYPNRTSPVIRGKWLLENMLGTPPPPPPPNVPALRDKNAQGKFASVRERLEEHRKNPACAVCHSMMDPLGFSLETFDAVGRWRTTDFGSAIDASGALPGGATFEGLSGLRDLILARREQFVRTVTEKLLAYSLGRSLDARDMPVVRQIVRNAAPTEYRWSSLILGIAKSMPFEMRRSAS